MYEIINLNSNQKKMQHILKEMTSLKHRQLEVSELEQIYLTLVKMINLTNCHSDFFKDISKTLFVINHYYHIKNNQYLLLESLHLCKLNMMTDEDICSKIDDCINIVGNFEINSALTQITTDIILITECYFTTIVQTELTESMFWSFIKTSIDSELFENSPFCLSISACLDDISENTNTMLVDLFKDLKTLLKDEYNYWNYSEFINWYIKNT